MNKKQLGWNFISWAIYSPLQEIAKQNRLPVLAVVDTGGAFLPLQKDIFLKGGRGFGNQAIMSSQGIQQVVSSTAGSFILNQSQVALVSGLCTAGGAYAPTMSDVAVITHRIGQFIYFSNCA